MFILFLIMAYIRRQVVALAQKSGMHADKPLRRIKIVYRTFILLLLVLCGIAIGSFFSDGLYAFVIIVLGLNIIIKLKLITHYYDINTKTDLEINEK